MVPKLFFDFLRCSLYGPSRPSAALSSEYLRNFCLSSSFFLFLFSLASGLAIEYCLQNCSLLLSLDIKASCSVIILFCQPKPWMLVFLPIINMSTTSSVISRVVGSRIPRATTSTLKAQTVAALSNAATPSRIARPVNATSVRHHSSRLASVATSVKGAHDIVAAIATVSLSTSSVKEAASLTPYRSKISKPLGQTGPVTVALPTIHTRKVSNPVADPVKESRLSTATADKCQTRLKAKSQSTSSSQVLNSRARLPHKPTIDNLPSSIRADVEERIAARKDQAALRLSRSRSVSRRSCQPDESLILSLAAKLRAETKQSKTSRQAIRIQDVEAYYYRQARVFSCQRCGNHSRSHFLHRLQTQLNVDAVIVDSTRDRRVRWHPDLVTSVKDAEQYQRYNEWEDSRAEGDDITREARQNAIANQNPSLEDDPELQVIDTRFGRRYERRLVDAPQDPPVKSSSDPSANTPSLGEPDKTRDAPTVNPPAAEASWEEQKAWLNDNINTMPWDDEDSFGEDEFFSGKHTPGGERRHR